MPQRQATIVQLDPVVGNQEKFLPADASLKFLRVFDGKIELIATSFYFPGGPPSMLWIFTLVDLAPAAPFDILGVASAPTREVCGVETENGPFLVLATPPQPLEPQPLE